MKEILGPMIMANQKVQLSETKTKWRDTMEDYSFVEEIVLSKMEPKHATICIYGVCDGHGGTEVSNFISKNMKNIVKNGLGGLEKPDQLLNPILIKKILCNCFALLETRLEMIFPINKIKSTGSTCSMVLSVPSLNVFYTINCGDSSVLGIYYDSSNSIKVSKITRLHKPDLVDELARIKKAGGFMVHLSGVARLSGVLAVSRSFGDIEHRKYGMTEIPEVFGPFKFMDLLTPADNNFVSKNTGFLSDVDKNPNEFIGFLIVSDGISDFITEDEICDLLMINFDKRTSFASILIENTNSQDNASVISVFV